MKDRNDWHLLSNDEVVRELSTDMYRGLSTEEAARRRKRFGKNSVWSIRHMSAWEIAYNTVFDLATLLLVITAVTAALFEQSTEALMITAILLLGGGLRTVTFVRANRIFEETVRETIPVATVLRDGKLFVVSADNIVPGDVVVLEAGDTVPCDGRIVIGKDALVHEKGITENKTPIHKFYTVINTSSEGGEVPCECRSNMVFATSVVLSGEMRIVATASGENTLAVMKNGRIVLEVNESMPIVDKLRRSSKLLSLIMLACVMVFTSLSFFKHEQFTLADIFLVTMSMAVASMSEFLTSIAEIVLAVTVRRAAGTTKKNKSLQRVKIKKTERIEEIAGVSRIVFDGSSFFKNGKTVFSYARLGTKMADLNKREDATETKQMLALMTAASGNANHSLSAGEKNEAVSRTSAYVRDMTTAFEKKFATRVEPIFSVIDHVSEDNPLSAGVELSLAIDRDGQIFASAIGTIDSVIRCCSSVYDGKNVIPLDNELKKKIFMECAKIEFNGGKVVGAARRPSPITSLNRASLLMQEMIFVGYTAIFEETEENVAESVRYLKQSGVELVMFSSNPQEDLYYGNRFGLFGKNTKILHYTEIEKRGKIEVGEGGLIVSFEGLAGDAAVASAYTKSMKKLSVDKVTAFVGRFWRGAGAMENADVGISVRNGTIHASEKSLVKHSAVEIYPAETTMDGFGGVSGLVRAVMAAGQAVRNIRSAVFYLTASQSARFIVLLAAILFDVPLMDAVFILMWGLLFDFSAVLMIGFEKFESYAPDRTPKNVRGYTGVTARAVFFGIAWGAILVFAVPAADWFGGLIHVNVTSGMLRSILSASSILTGYIVSCAAMKRRISSMLTSVSMAQTALLVVAVIFALSVLFYDKTAYLIGGALCFGVGMVTVLPLILTFMVLGVGKLMSGNNI